MNTQSYLILRSDDRDRAQDESPARVYFTEKQRFFSNVNVATVEVESLSMFYDIPNINVRNNVLLLDTGVQTYPAYLAEGYYTYTSLATSLLLVLNGLGLGAFTLSWNPIIQKFVMTTPVPIKVIKASFLKRDLGEMMGFEYDVVDTNFVGGSSDISYTRDIYFISSTLHRHKRIDDQASNPAFTDILCVVPVYGNNEVFRSNSADPNQQSYMINPRNIFYQPTWFKKVRFNPDETISNIVIELQDDQGEPLYNPHGKQSYRWRLTLMLNRA